jgi:hypothetical protein
LACFRYIIVNTLHTGDKKDDDDDDDKDNNNNNNNKSKEKFGSHTRKTFNKLTTKDSYTRNITHKKESTTV